MLIKYLLTLFYTHYYMGKNKLDMVGKKTKHKKKKLTKKEFKQKRDRLEADAIAPNKG